MLSCTQRVTQGWEGSRELSRNLCLRQLRNTGGVTDRVSGRPSSGPESHGGAGGHRLTPSQSHSALLHLEAPISTCSPGGSCSGDTGLRQGLAQHP